MINVKNLSKTYRIIKRNSGMKQALKSFFHREYEVIHAIKDISFNINDGEIVGYIGPNGAGKSSTIKIMSGILTPDSGDCTINGFIPWKNRIEHVRNIGVVFGQRSQLWWDVPVIDSFELLKDIYEVDEATYKNNLYELQELLNLSEIIKTPTRQLSLGQRMRCEIAASLLHSPKVVFLDEPTIGLDAVSKIAVRQFIKKINSEKKTTIILTTHDMQDIEALTERILLIGDGSILLDSSLSELKKRNSKIKNITVDYSTGSFNLDENSAIILIKNNENHAEFSVDTDKITVSNAISMISKNVEINDISVSGTSAEELVVSLYKEYDI